MTNFTKIINDFVNKMGYQENEDVEGIVYYGSSQTGYSNDFSDIDLHIIFNNNLEQSIRGSMTIDEVRVEYFEKSINSMYKKALTEFKNQANAMVSMIEYGTIIFDRNGKIKSLQEYVRQLYSLPMPCIDDEQAKELIAIINNFFDDLKNCIETNDLYSAHIYHLTLERIKDFYFSYYGLPGVARTKALKTMFLLMFLITPVAFAKDNVFYTNYAGVQMTETEYNYMIENFDEVLVKNMSQTLFESALKDVNNIELASQEYKYIETTFNPNLMLTTEKEITKEEYENYNPIMPLTTCDYGVACWETNAKRLSISVYNNTENGYQAVTIENAWKTIPNVKSFDVIAVRWSSNNGYYPNIARMDGQQVYRQSTGTLTEHMYDIETQNTKVNSDKTAVGISMNIGDNAYQFLSNVIYLEFIVTKNVTLTFDATYQHATSTVTLAQSHDYTFGAGGLGNVLKYNSNTIKNKYDNMQGVSTMVAYIP